MRDPCIEVSPGLFLRKVVDKELSGFAQVDIACLSPRTEFKRAVDCITV